MNANLGFCPNGLLRSLTPEMELPKMASQKEGCGAARPTGARHAGSAPSLILCTKFERSCATGM